MLFYSTNKKSPPVTFEQALLQGLAPDGGLYFPEYFPQFNQTELEYMKHFSLQKIGMLLLQKWIGDEIPTPAIRQIITKALDFPLPLQQVGPYKILELTHGPTMAFKDIAAKVLGQTVSYFLKKQNKTATVLVATSGDTGGAVAQGFAGVDNVKVIILFPKGKVSTLQEEQLTRVPENIISIEVDGVFDDCQSYVKKAFNDPDLQHLNLTSANSINIGRLIPQSIYFLYVYAQLYCAKIQFVVPSGNMGNSTAGLFAKKMGLPFNSFLIATNENDPVVEYYKTGKYKPQKSVSTLSNAMDIGSPSNFVRVLELFQHNYEEFKKIITAKKITDVETVKTIKKVYEKYNYLLDPHTAVAWTAAEKYGNKDFQQVIISTASPIKFAREIEKATGIKVDDSGAIKKIQQKEKRKIEAKNSYKAIKSLL